VRVDGKGGLEEIWAGFEGFGRVWGGRVWSFL
jgi:hypothetical protein